MTKQWAPWLSRTSTTMVTAIMLIGSGGLPLSPAAGDPVIGTATSLTFQTPAPQIPVDGAEGMEWRVVNKITQVKVGTGKVTGGSAWVQVPGVGIYTIEIGNSSADFVVLGKTPSHDYFYGVQTHFAWPEAHSSWSNPERTLSDLRKLGFSSIRDEVYWDRTETAPRVYALRERDRIYHQAAQRFGFDRLFTADFGNDALGVNRPPATPEEQKAFADYAIWVIQQTGVKRVELWNEFNHGQFNNGCKTGVCYATQFGPIADMIHTAVPDVQVIGGATSNAPLDWFRDFNATGGLAAMDAISYHPYAMIDKLNNFSSLVRTLREQQTAVLPQGTKPKPVRITEVGWSTSPRASGGNPAKTLSNAEQAERLVYSYLMHAAEPDVEATYWYDAVDDGTNPNATEENFGIFRAPTEKVPTFQPKEAALAMWVLRSQLDGYKQVSLAQVDGIWRAGYVNPTGDRKAIVFTDPPQGPIMMPDPRARTIPISSLSPEGSVATSALDIYGTPVDLNRKDITVSTKPILLSMAARTAQ